MKRVLSCILALVLMVSMIPVSSITAYAIDNKVESAIAWAISIANDNTHGYSQANRTGPDYDCSSFVSTAFKKAGFSVSGSLHTGNMLNAFVSAGFTKYNKGAVTLQRGDILLRPKTSSKYGHTELYIGNNQCVAAHSDNDGKTGDSGGKEIDVRSKNYCTFCKNSDYTYILRYEGSSSSNNYTYSFNFNANGGTLGSSGSFSVTYGEQFQILNTTCTRSGYTWAGWNVKRNNDNKWYVAGQGWCTESQISDNGYIKKVYPNSDVHTLDNSWSSGMQGDCSYTFYAVWVKDRTTMLYVFMSPLGAGGYTHIEALNNAVTYGFAQEHMYFWYVIYDQKTGDLLSTYLDKNFTATMTVTDPTGEIIKNKKYTTSDDANWIGFTPGMSGTYTATVTLGGDYDGATLSTTYDVKYDAELEPSATDVSLNLNGTNTKTVEFTPSGYYPGSKGYTANLDSSIASVTEHYWSGEKFYFTIKGNKVGEAPLTVKLYENYTGNKNVVATITIPVKVTANTYIISYDANGGSGAPPSQTKYYGTDLTLSSTKPVGKTFTVTFDGNGGSVSSATKTYTQSFAGWNTYKSGAGASYSSGSTFSSNLDVTLYAQWTNPNFKSINAAREGYYFVGWYDSKSTDSAGLPTGKKYTSSTKISSNITLYAMWSKSADLLFGDYNLDGEITYLEDVSALLNLVNGLITTDYPIQEVMFRCDLNRDGELDAADALIINKLRLGEITQSDLSSVGSKYVGMEIGEYPQRDFRYGGELETEYLSTVAFFENGTAYLIEDNYVVSGYDPYKIGTQTLTVNYYQYSTSYTVTVHPPQYTVKLDANGGTVKYSGYTFTYGEKIGTLVSPEREGYTFLGWTFEETGKNYVKPTDVYSYMSNKTLYAQWERNSYTVSYNANGGSGVPTSQTKTHNVDLALSSIQPTRTGYKFLGWATNSTDTTAIYQPNGNYVENADVTLFAVWKVNTYTVSYDANGGSGAPTSQIKNHNVDLTLSSVEPTRVGYKFMGWATNSSATLSSYQSGATFTANENTTLYAIWSKNDVNSPSAYLQSTNNLSNIQTVTLNMYDDEGVFAYYWGTDSTYANNEYCECSFIATNINTEKQVAEPGVYGLTVVDINGNVSATYIITFYKTTLNANGGNISTTSILTKSGNSVTLPTPTRNGYTFLGWSTSSTATSATYQAGASFATDADTVLYAVWSKDDTTKPSVTIAVSHKVATSQTVSLELSDDNGLASYYFGTSSSPSDSAFVEITATTSKTISKTVSSEGTYYVFVKDTSGNISERQEISFCKTILNANGGSVTSEYIITRRGHWIELPTPTNEGSTFVGWGTSSTATSGVTTVTPNSNATYYAIWEVTPEPVVLGDVNGDESIDAGDAGLISRYDAGLITLTATQLEAGDVNGDGVVDAGDAGLISRYDAGLISQIGY